MWFFFRCIILVKNCTRIYTAITVGGLALLIILQASLHVLVNVGIIPVTGHTLPLISLGGTSLVILCSAFGIILSVSRTIDVSSVGRKPEIAANAGNATINLTEEEYETTVAENTDSLDEEVGQYEIKDKNGEFK